MKRVFRRVFQIIFHPAAAWSEIADEMHEGRHNVFAEYLYPLVSYCALICFAAKLLTAHVADSTVPFGELVPQAFLEIVGFFFIFVGGLYVTYFLVRSLLPSDWRGMVPGHPLMVLLSYSLTLIVVLRTVGSIVEVFSFLGFPFQFYTLYIVWEGTKNVLNVPDKSRLTLSVLTALLLILVTTLIARGYGALIQ